MDKPDFVNIPVSVRRLLSGHGKLYVPPLDPQPCLGPEPGACAGCDADAELLAAWTRAEASTATPQIALRSPALEHLPEFRGGSLYVTANRATQALLDVLNERGKQDVKFGEQNIDPFHYLACIMEEAGEYAEAALQTVYGGPKGGLSNMRKELVHTAAIALSALESFDRNKWHFGVNPASRDALRVALESAEKGRQQAEEDNLALADSLAFIVGSNDPAHLRAMRAEMQLNPEEHGGGEHAPGYLRAVESLIRFRERQATARVESNDP